MMSIKTRSRTGLMLVAILAVGAVNAQGGPGPENGAVVDPLQAVVDKALDDAATQTGLARDLLEVMSADAVIWPDGSLGCPRPDVVYTQAPVPGYRVRIRADGAILDYHANARGLLTLCPSGIMADPISRGTR